MYKGVFFCTFGYGELIPPLRMVEELIKQKHDIVCYCTSEYQPLIERSGAIFRDYNAYNDKALIALCTMLIEQNNKRYLTYKEKKDIEVLKKKINERMYSKYKNEIDYKEIDYIITNYFNEFVVSLAEEYDLAVIYIHCNFAYCDEIITRETDFAMKYFYNLDDYYTDEFLEDYHGIKKNKSKYDKIIHILFFNKLLQPFYNYFDDSYKFVGSTVAQRRDFWGDELTNDSDIANDNIYISMGSVLSMRKYYLDFYLTCVEAFKNLSHQVIINVGTENKKTILSKIDNIPENIKLLSHAPQIKILEKSKLFITHGGMGSFQEALYFGVKMIIIPHNGDQFITAKVAEENLIGLQSDIHVSKEKLIDLYNELETNKDIEKSCRKFRNEVRREDGGKAGAAEIILFLEKHEKVYTAKPLII